MLGRQGGDDIKQLWELLQSWCFLWVKGLEFDGRVGKLGWRKVGTAHRIWVLTSWGAGQGLCYVSARTQVWEPLNSLNFSIFCILAHGKFSIDNLKREGEEVEEEEEVSGKCKECFILVPKGEQFCFRPFKLFLLCLIQSPWMNGSRSWGRKLTT